MASSGKRSLFIATLCAALFTLASFTTSAEAQSKPLKNVPVVGAVGAGVFHGSLSITALRLGEGGLLATGKVTGTLNRLRINQPFTDVPVSLVREGDVTPESISPAALSPDEPFVCDILFLDLAPLNLNLLGLQLDLDEVVLDLDALSGPGNLVGNLLCAVTGLLDVVDLGVLLQGILESLLDAINGLL